MSKLDEDLRWIKKGYIKTNDADILKKNTLKPNTTSDDLQKHISSNAFHESTNTLDDGAIERWQHITKKNSLEHPYPDALKGFNVKYSNSLLANLNSIEDVSKCLNYDHASIETCSTSNSKHNFENNNSITEPWRERNHTDKMRLAWLSYMNSLAGKIFPCINLHTIANPFLSIPTEVSRMANSINLNMAEVLCRKRIETALIYWMAYKFNQLNAFK